MTRKANGSVGAVLFPRTADFFGSVRLRRPIWDKFLDFETRKAAGGGSLGAVRKVEERRAAAYAGSIQSGRSSDHRGVAVRRALPAVDICRVVHLSIA